MNLLKLTISCLLIFILSYGVAGAQSVELFVAARGSGEGQECGLATGALEGVLYSVNPENAQSNLLGPIGFSGITALEFLGDGRLVGSAKDDLDNGSFIRRSVLLEINPETGLGSEIGIIGREDTTCGRAPGLTYDADNNILYGTADRCTTMPAFLQTINQATGNGSTIGPINGYSGGMGIAIRDDGVIFATGGSVGTGFLITVNPSDGSPTEVGETGFTMERINALAFHPITGELYGTTVLPLPETSRLVTVNTETGEATVVGDLPNCADGLVFKPLPPIITEVPTLSEWGLIAMAGILGIVGFMVIRRRKVTA